MARVRRAPAAPSPAMPAACSRLRLRRAVAVRSGWFAWSRPGSGRSGQGRLSTSRQRGRWLLHEAREQLHLGNYDVAQRKADEAEALDVKWGLFDDTPAKVTEEIKKARPRMAVARRRAPRRSLPHDRRTAEGQAPRGAGRARRPPVRAGRSDRAGSQGLGADLRVLRGQSRTRSPPPPVPCAAATRSATRPHATSRARASTTCWCRNRASSSRGGKLDEAEAKARQAQRMNVVPPLTADRAESVLHEIAMARAPEVDADDRPQSASADDCDAAPTQCQDGAQKPTSCSPRVIKAARGRSSSRPIGCARQRVAQAAAEAQASSESAQPTRRSAQIAARPSPAPDLTAPADRPRRRCKQPALAIEGPQPGAAPAAPEAAGACRGSAGT